MITEEERDEFRKALTKILSVIIRTLRRGWKKSGRRRCGTVRLNKRVLLLPEFLELWGKIKKKTTYRVSIDTEELVKRCVRALREMPRLQKTRLISQTADIHLEQAGVSHTERETRFTGVDNAYRVLPDFVTILSDAALLTPATVTRILLESGRCGDLMELCAREQLKIHCGKKHFDALENGVEMQAVNNRNMFKEQLL